MLSSSGPKEVTYILLHFKTRQSPAYICSKKEYSQKSVIFYINAVFSIVGAQNTKSIVLY